VRSHSLRFAIAVVSAAGCGGTQTLESTTEAKVPPPSTTAAPHEDSVAEAPQESQEQGDPTAGTGACRCSWEAKPQGVARVCRVGEHSHTGALCVRATRPKYGTGVMLGPLPPPDLSA
jgi:hypothetical protein